MIWTSANDFKAQLHSLWERGELLRSLVNEQTLFPLHLKLKTPNSLELAERFQAVRTWISEVTTLPYLRVEYREINHRILGLQRIPQSVWVDSLDNALVLIDKCREAACFIELLAFTRAKEPQLLTWLAKWPLRAIELAERWERLIAVVNWLVRHPHPGIYLRQVDIPGVHSKFIETHRDVLASLLDLTLAPEAIEVNRSGIKEFAARYGFLDKPIRIRFRVLDSQIVSLPGTNFPDIALDSNNFANLTLPIRRVFITENETNFLVFPHVVGSIVIFGTGYGWSALAKANWLSRCTIHYWGDIDTNGFAILNQLRNHFEHVESFLMDQSTLMAHQQLWGEEMSQITRDLPKLTPVEQQLFNDLRDNRIRKGLRLEQEHVNFQWLKAALDNRFQ